MILNHSISAACSVLGFSRQAYYKRDVQNDKSSLDSLLKILPDVVKARKKRPTKGCRSIYEDYAQSWPLGRDKSVSLLIEAGFGVRFPKKYHRATQAGNREFSNLLVNKTVNHINQVWQSDMAHYLVEDKRFYTIYITDVYSQEIVGHGAYTGNQADNYAEVLLHAIKAQKTVLNGLIHHSDGGKQYESKIYKDLCEKYGLTQSMCMYSYENPYAEKTNDLINNGYLNCWKPKSLNQVCRMQTEAVKDHNLNSKKKRLGKKSPLEFKGMLKENNNTLTKSLQLKPSNPEQPRNKRLTLN
jgi:putative transposase